MLRLSQLRFGGTPQIPVLTQPRRETLQHLRRFYLVAWLIWWVCWIRDQLAHRFDHRGLRCIVLIVDKADRLGWSAASYVQTWGDGTSPTPSCRPHKLALAKQAAYVLGTSCIGIALEIWGSYTLLHFWNTPRCEGAPHLPASACTPRLSAGAPPWCSGSRCSCTSTWRC